MFRSSGHRIGFPVASRSAATLDSFRVKTPVPANNGWDTLSKQGNALLRYLLGEAAQAAARCNPDWRRRYVHLAMRRHKNIAKAAMARKLAVRLYWMWRNSWDYSQLVEFGSHAGKLATGHGVN